MPNPTVPDVAIADTDPNSRPFIVPYALSILAEMQAVFEKRGDSYADIEDNSKVYAEIMRGLGVTFPSDMSATQFHCMANIATKLARFATGDRMHEDTFIDIAGYAILIAAAHRRNKETPRGQK